MHLQVVGFMVALFTEDHGEITNPAACNQVRVSSRSHAAAIPPHAYYLNIKKPISLARHARRVFFVVGVIAAMLGTDMVVLLYFTRHSSGSVVIQQPLSMPDTCWPASHCPSSPLTTTGNRVRSSVMASKCITEQSPGICSAHMRPLSVCLILCSKITVTTMYLFSSRHAMDQFYDPI